MPRFTRPLPFLTTPPTHALECDAIIESIIFYSSSPRQVHGDVFRPPANASLLATYVGTGVQLFSCILITMTFALLGFLSPANRGGLMTAAVMMFVFMGLLAGFSSARLYKGFRGEEWKRMTLRTALLFPGGGADGVVGVVVLQV